MGGSVLANYLSWDQITGKAHCIALNRGYLEASRPLLDIAIGFFDLRC